MGPKFIWKSMLKFIDFLICFCTVFETPAGSWESPGISRKTPQRRPRNTLECKGRPKRPQQPSESPKRQPQGPPRAPKRQPQRPPKKTQGHQKRPQRIAKIFKASWNPRVAPDGPRDPQSLPKGSLRTPLSPQKATPKISTVSRSVPFLYTLSFGPP